MYSINADLRRSRICDIYACGLKHVISSNMICILDAHIVCLIRQVIIYVDDANDEVPVFTQQQYNRLGLRETAGIGTSVIVVRATDPDTGECSCLMSGLAVDSSQHQVLPKTERAI